MSDIENIYEQLTLDDILKKKIYRQTLYHLKIFRR